MKTLTRRLEKLEQASTPTVTVGRIIVEEHETEDEVKARMYPDGRLPGLLIVRKIVSPLGFAPVEQPAAAIAADLAEAER